jgi:hypothetical protein
MAWERFLFTTTIRIEVACTLVDTQLKDFFVAHLPRNKPEVRLPDFPYPHCPVRPCYSVGIPPHAETLKQAVIAQEDTVIHRPPTRPPKQAPITFVYVPNKFLTPPAKKKKQKNQSNPGKTVMSANSSITQTHTT